MIITLEFCFKQIDHKSLIVFYIWTFQNKNILVNTSCVKCQALPSRKENYYNGYSFMNDDHF